MSEDAQLLLILFALYTPVNIFCIICTCAEIFKCCFKAPEVPALPSNPQPSPVANYHHIINIPSRSVTPRSAPGPRRDIRNPLPTFADDTSSRTNTRMECVICLTVLNDKEVCRELPGCKHTFHTECIDMWLFSHSSCPLCRANVEVHVEPVRPEAMVETISRLV